MNQITKTLVGAGVLAAAAAGALSLAVLEKKGKQADSELKERDKKAFPDLKSENITEVELTYQGATVKAKKEGSQWMLSEPVVGEGDDAALAAVTSAVANLALKSRIKDGELDPANVELKDASHRVRVKDSAGAVAEVWVGRKSGFNEAYYVRFGADASKAPLAMVESYQLNGLQKSPTDLREKRMVKVLSSDVEELKVDVAQPTADAVSFVAVRRVKEGKTHWDDEWDLAAPAALLADKDEINRAIQGITSARVTAFAAEGADTGPLGLSAPALTVTVKGKGTTTVVRVGTVTRDGVTEHWAQREGSKEVGQLPEAAVNGLRRAAFTWRDKRVATFDRDAVASVDLVLPDGVSASVKKVSAADASPEVWRVSAPKDAPARNWKVTSMIYALSNLKASRVLQENVATPAPPAVLSQWGLDKPSRVAALKDAAGKELARVLVGRAEGGDLAVMVQGGSAIWAVEKAKVDDLPADVDALVDSPDKPADE